jgi:uncharacterized protein
MPENPRLRVTVACALPECAFLREVELAAGARVVDAIDASGLRRAWPEVEIAADRVGVFARRVRLDALLRDGDRVEIYRALRIDPKEARRRRAKKA